ncbi:hypothetical protein [Brevibacterium linens]|uniref:hypothetical protein n=1 Tax=Brevibacterium linens TaxID=1703 RepID=UPI003F8B32FC
MRVQNPQTVLQHFRSHPQLVGRFVSVVRPFEDVNEGDRSERLRIQVWTNSKTAKITSVTNRTLKG